MKVAVLFFEYLPPGLFNLYTINIQSCYTVPEVISAIHCREPAISATDLQYILKRFFFCRIYRSNCLQDRLQFAIPCIACGHFW